MLDVGRLLAFDAIGVVWFWMLIMLFSMAFIGGLTRVIDSPQSQLSEVVGMSIWSSLVFLCLIILLIRKNPQLSVFKTFGW